MFSSLDMVTNFKKLLSARRFMKIPRNMRPMSKIIMLKMMPKIANPLKPLSFGGVGFGGT